jgi:hypothetical protein
MENNKTSFHKFMDATQGVNVEFSLIDDIKSKISRGNIILKEIDRLVYDIRKEIEIIKGLSTNVQDYKRFGSDIFNDAVILEKQVKELGIQKPQEIEEAKKIYRSINEGSSLLNDLVKQIR